MLFLLTARKSPHEIVWAVAAFLLGCAIEVMQYLTGFSVVLEWWDVRDDFIATLSVFLVFGATHVIRYSKRP